MRNYGAVIPGEQSPINFYLDPRNYAVLEMQCHGWRWFTDCDTQYGCEYRWKDFRV